MFGYNGVYYENNKKRPYYILDIIDRSCRYHAFIRRGMG
jgi:hypothetical protein